MSMEKDRQMIRIRVAGPDAEAMATEAEAFLAETFAVTPARAAAAPAPDAKRGDPVAIAALVLSVPSAVLATLDLAKRLELADRLDRFLSRLRAHTGIAQLQIDTHPPLDLGAAPRDQIIDALTHPSDRKP
jgi:hypothetical protein